MKASDILAQHMTETELLGSVLDLCATLGLLAHHCRPALTAKGWRTPIQGDRGFPDLVIAGDADVLYPELKNATGTLDADQRRWRDKLGPTGRWRLWRPEHWFSGEIRAELEALSRGEPVR